MYLLIDDNFSQTLEVAKLYTTTSIHFLEIWNSGGIDYRQWPKEFSKRYGSTHVTSSPRYPQGCNKAG